MNPSHVREVDMRVTKAKLNKTKNEHSTVNKFARGIERSSDILEHVQKKTAPPPHL